MASCHRSYTGGRPPWSTIYHSQGAATNESTDCPTQGRPPDCPIHRVSTHRLGCASRRPRSRTASCAASKRWSTRNPWPPEQNARSRQFGAALPPIHRQPCNGVALLSVFVAVDTVRARCPNQSHHVGHQADLSGEAKHPLGGHCLGVRPYADRRPVRHASHVQHVPRAEGGHEARAKKVHE